MQQARASSEAEVTWEDQQNINRFGRLNNRLHELDDEIKIAKEVRWRKMAVQRRNYVTIALKWLTKSHMPRQKGIFVYKTWSNRRLDDLGVQSSFLRSTPNQNEKHTSQTWYVNQTNESLEDASNELILTDEEIVRFPIGEVFAHVPKEEVESRIEQMNEVTSKNLEKLEEEKESILSQMGRVKEDFVSKV
ncbi:hypothetical protein Pfo_005355 [Paulownia fortunei]|nr:hypothetical protein Pfo_005355 [Paulownia fortunei]